MNFAEKAAYYIETLGWPVFPVSRNKVPCVKGGCHAASLDPDIIADWDRQFPHANIAVATGKPSGVIVVDVDGPTGDLSWRKLVKLVWMSDREPECPTVITGKGRHLYFSGSDIGNRASSVLGLGIDVRGDGGSATLPPSVHENGKEYVWSRKPGVVQPPHLPPAMLRLLKGEEAWPDPRKRKYKRVEPKHGDLPPDLDRLVEMVMKAGPGERNHTLNMAAFLAAKTIRAGAASEGFVMDRLTDAALAVGLDRTEISGTIKSGIRAGEQKL